MCEDTALKLAYCETVRLTLIRKLMLEQEKERMFIYSLYAWWVRRELTQYGLVCYKISRVNLKAKP